ncbi:MAG: radical SAM protein [Bacteroidales bacterium]|nr:radical SAM protein [Bacteroidales bacterium]MDT8373546.1 radical SAM protein [Bacteroidales bacterium]
MRPSPKPVILVAFGEEENLGAGYLMSLLNGAGIANRMIDFRYDKSEILEAIRRDDPIAVGFSVIFEVCIGHFVSLVQYLREGGIECHFTAGGYYASLYPEELLGMIPELDSIVRFEGEYPFLELVQCLINGSDWRNVKNLAFPGNGEITRTPLREPENDLDRFPVPVRRPLREYVPGIRYATILSGRGCNYNCSFCNTREFYRQAGGPPRRIRRPEMVVREMHQLYSEKRCKVFLFLDDDNPVKTARDNKWMKDFCSELERTGLSGKLIWKMNCRPDEIEPVTFAMMKKHGLFLVFIGLEDGTDEGLTRLNKKMTVASTLRGVEILTRLNIGFDYGMLLFQPDSTFMSLRDNLSFLEGICRDCNVPVTFLKLSPYFGTQVERELRNTGRLKGQPGILDYNFLTEALDACWAAVSESFAEWLWGREGVVNLAKWVRNYLAVWHHFGNSSSMEDRYRGIYSETVAQSNLYLVDTMTDLFNYYESGDYLRDGQQHKQQIRTDIGKRHQGFCATFTETLKSLRTEALY